MKILFNSIFISSMLTLFFTSNTFANEKHLQNKQSNNIVITSEYSYPTKDSYSDEEMKKAEKESLKLLKQSDDLSILVNLPGFMGIEEAPELDLPSNYGYSTFFSVPTKIVIKNTKNYTDFDDVLDTSPIVEKGMSVSLTYEYDTYAELSCDFSINQNMLERKLGFKLGASVHKATTLSKNSAPYNGYIAVYPQYSLSTFEVYTRSRRPVGKHNPWIFMGTGTVKRLRNAFCRFVRE